MVSRFVVFKHLVLSIFDQNTSGFSDLVSNNAVFGLTSFSPSPAAAIKVSVLVVVYLVFGFNRNLPRFFGFG